jgi:excisionase family DNA binding protein
MSIPRTSDPQRRLVSLDACAAYLGLSRKTVRRYVASGVLPAYRVGRRALRVDLDVVDRVLVRPLPTTSSAFGTGR